LRPQDFLFGKLEAEILRKTIRVPLHLPIHQLYRYLKKAGDVAIEHHLDAADRDFGRNDIYMSIGTTRLARPGILGEDKISKHRSHRRIES